MSGFTKKELEELLAERDRQIEDLQDELECAMARAEMAVQSYETIENSFFWRMSKPARDGLDWVKDAVQLDSYAQMAGKVRESVEKYGVAFTLRKIKTRLMNAPSYRRWVKDHAVSDEELEVQRNTAFKKDTRFSIIVPLYNTPEEFLREMIGSVQAQTYAGWELCMADGSDREHPEVGRICAEYSSSDKRIKYKKLERNLGIAGNTNECLELATGDYIALFDHDDILHPSALYEMMKVICDTDADIVYTDELVFISPKISNIKNIHFKPDFAPDNLRANNYMCHFTAFKRTLLDEAGLFRPECDGSQDHDLMLRITEKAGRIEHIPKVMYYWRAHPQSVAMSNSAKSYAAGGGRKAVSDSIERMGMHGKVFNSKAIDSIYRIKYEIASEPLVSIIVSEKKGREAFDRCTGSIRKKTTYKNYEIIGTSPAGLNETVKTKATGEMLILVDDSIEIISPEWIEEMLMYAQRKDIGAVGPMLYYPDNTIDQAGMILGRGGSVGPASRGLAHDDLGYMGRLCYSQNMSAVSGACMMIRRDVWDQVGGIDSVYGTLADADLCMRVRKEGYLIVWTPYAEMYHHDNREGRGRKDKGAAQGADTSDRSRFISRWSAEIEAGDPYYNSNFTLDTEKRDYTV